MLGNIDPAVRSRLEAINLIALFRSELLQHYSFDDILKPFVSDLKKLTTVFHIHKHSAGELYTCFFDYIYSLEVGL